MESVLRGLGRKYHAQIVKYGTVVGAFVLLQCSDRNVSSQAYSWLQGIGVDELPLKNPVPPSKVIEALSWLISLTGPIVLAVDQLDPIVSYHNLIASGSDALDDDEERQAQTIIEGLCRGLSEIFEVTLRTTTVLSCLEATWQILTGRALRSFEGRFNDPILLAPITAAQAAGDLITARTTETYQRLRFNPPYPSWPIAKEAFATAVGLPPRDVLRRCDAHRRKCIANQKVIELKSFAGAALPPVPKPTADSSLDTRLTALRTAANVAGLCDEEHEEELSDLLLTALECYCMQTELSDNVDLAVEGDPHKRKPALHARLRRIYREEGDREEHHCFRAIPHANAIAFQSRLKAAMTAAGIDMSLPFRHLFVIRLTALPSGARTQQLCDTFKKAGGKFVSLSDDDLGLLVALQTMFKERPEGFEPWLKQRKPLCDIAMFRDVGLCGPHADEGLSAAKPKSRPISEPRVTQPSAAKRKQEAEEPAKPAPPASIFIGRRLIDGQVEQPRYLALDLLPRHTAVLAGSGSGKTVLLRRIIEEAALQGVPAIVLDTNNDLARLGDPWPERLAVWDEVDRDKSKRYTSDGRGGGLDSRHRWRQINHARAHAGFRSGSG